MIEKLKWTDAFFHREIFKSKKDYVPTPESIVKEIVLNLRECPGCGYVFENAFHKTSNDVVIFAHGWRARTEKCEMKMSEIRTIYHIKRAAKIASGVVKS